MICQKLFRSSQCSSLASLEPGPDGRARASFWVRPGLPYLMALTSELRAPAHPSGPSKLLGRARAYSVVRNTGSSFHQSSSRVRPGHDSAAILSNWKPPTPITRRLFSRLAKTSRLEPVAYLTHQCCALIEVVAWAGASPVPMMASRYAHSTRMPN